jgi:hypothetical protein
MRLCHGTLARIGKPVQLFQFKNYINEYSGDKVTEKLEFHCSIYSVLIFARKSYVIFFPQPYIITFPR